MANGLTERQQQVLDYIVEVRRSEGHAPTIQEIQGAFGFRSPNAVQSYIGALERKNAIVRKSRKPRGLEVVPHQAHPALEDGPGDPPTLTDRQEQILDFIRLQASSTGHAPTIKEIMSAFGYHSPNTVQSHLAALVKKGAIARQPRTPRGLRPLALQPPAGHGPHAEARMGSGSASSAAEAKEAVEARLPGPEAGLEPAPTPRNPDQLAIDVHFVATHQTRTEFDGIPHRHAWRLQVCVRRPAGNAGGAADALHAALQALVAQLDGATLNDLDQFVGLQPGLESVARWLARGVKAAVASRGLELASMTLWDEPGEGLTIRSPAPVAAEAA